jgi:hypothetical protein
MISVSYKGVFTHLKTHDLRNQTRYDSCSENSSTCPSESSDQDVNFVTLVHLDPDKDVSSLPYVPLDPEFMKYMCWSNHPNDLELAVYFNKLTPNLSTDYNVEGLKPVVKEKRSYRFILRDAKQRYYLWDKWDGRLLRVPIVYIEGPESTEEIVENIVVYRSFIARDAVAIWSNRSED